MPKKTNWPILVLLGVLALLLVGEEVRFGIVRAICHIAAVEMREDLGRRAFNSAGWQSKHATEGKYSIRSRMVDSLLSRHRLVGMSRKQVTKLLGPPDLGSTNEYEYTLGMERGWLKIDGEVLTITFDSSGIAVKAETHVT